MIEYRDVWARRGDTVVLRGVTLAVESGETLALVGRSGAGKTTLLRLVNRLTDVDRGAVLVEERDTRAWDPIALRRRAGYVVQDVGLFPHFTVERNVATVPLLLGWSRPRIEARVADLLALVGLEANTFRSRWPDELSGGQRQRVGLARALAADPAMLLMDEPFGALDPMTRVGLHEAFRALQARQRRTVLLVTHDISEAFALADRVAVIDEGVVIAAGPPAALTETADPRVRALVDTRFE
jgi:osmoprotectant transport system ATP-binding protein